MIDGYLADPASGQADMTTAQAEIPAEAVSDLEAVMSDIRVSYRDGGMIQLAYG
ncbi:MAG: hypothetical protein JJU19_00925 [Pararhodobacter sp.]|nr:hypothetical protein [Pararhodobacter sp.]